MDNLTTRTIIIAVNIFITITIVSLVIIMFFQMQEIYGIVATADTSIYNKFDNVYSMYHGKQETGLGLINTIKKYEDNNEQNVVISYPNASDIRKEIEEANLNLPDEHKQREATYLKELMKNNGTYKGEKYTYSDRYNVSVMEDETNEGFIINFEKVN